jgi:hypothetical protein
VALASADALETQKVCDAVLEGAKQGRWVDVAIAGETQSP